MCVCVCVCSRARRGVVNGREALLEAQELFLHRAFTVYNVISPRLGAVTKTLLLISLAAPPGLFFFPFLLFLFFLFFFFSFFLFLISYPRQAFFYFALTAMSERSLLRGSPRERTRGFFDFTWYSI